MRLLKLHKHRPVLAALLAVASAVTMVPRDASAAVNGVVVANAADPRAGGRLFAATSPFNQVIPTNPELDPRSASYVSLMNRSKKEKGFSVAVKEWAIPAYFAKPGTARRDVLIAGQPPGAHYDRTFVHDVQRIMRGVPIPDNAQPDPMDDAHLTVIDPANGCEYDLYGAKRTAKGWTALWANATSTPESGIYPYGLSSRATGFSPLAGMIWPAELRAGRIDHALVFAYPYTRSGGPVYPATASDGKTNLAAALPQGARVQLDPALDLSKLKLTAYERTIAEALQRYGMYLGDTGGAMALYAVSPQSFDTSNPYAGLLPDDPYVFLEKIPVNRFRVLKTGAQLAQTPLTVVPSSCARIDVIG
ncbi:hypothetical protein [Paractinoplanes lichenicola]|uniref:Uncharacterized protein n=1 Tax=Paractinoplanes lichenicola TaxID=2802976 RepID=A0ABS1W6E3_9ACTN|nr:hypothetical protein [Actinoplanes lichenicola]MBL7262312.1 hypothetical protein [Actinoplanes lichenicola]